jgi:hypothetical protein
VFRHRFQTSQPKTPPTEPVEGFLFRIQQQALHFGADRKIPVQSRPALPWKRRDNWAVVLPATSKPNNTPSFFKLDESDVRWIYANPNPIFISCNYETIQATELHHKLAVISQNARMNIAHWLRRKHG